MSPSRPPLPQPLPQLPHGPLCQPLPQPPLCQPLPQPPLCQPLPQPPLCQPPLCQPPLCQPQPPLCQPLPHQASCFSGSTATNGSPSLAYCCSASETERRIDCRRSATSPGFFGWAPTSGDVAAAASAEARLTEKPKAPAGNNAASARTERRSWAMQPPMPKAHVTQTCDLLANEKRKSIRQVARRAADHETIGIDPDSVEIRIVRGPWNR